MMLALPMTRVAGLTTLIMLLLNYGGMNEVAAGEPFVIAASPSLAAPVEALAHAFETTHPDVGVRIFFDTGLALRQTIAGMENSPKGQYFIGTGPIHVVAPGGDELITRLEQKY